MIHFPVITACMATFPGRCEIFDKVAERLLPQVDELRVYVNDLDKFETTPELFKYCEISTGADIGDVGKVANLPDDGYCFLVDDDILYPDNYTAYLIGQIDRFSREVIVGCHAAVLSSPIRNYFTDRRVYHFKAGLWRDTWVNVLGTGTLAFHTSYIDFPESLDMSINMLDIHFAVYCQQHHKRMLSVKRVDNWLKPVPTSGSIWDSRGDGKVQTAKINEVTTWNVY